MSPTQRTLAEMRKRGYYAEVVEYWNHITKRRHDLAGFIDVLCFGDGEIVGVQATSLTNVSARVTKIAEHENVAAVRRAGMRLLVQGWGKMPNGRYRLREVDCS